jgi:aspartate-semialdehyde dehydrogenase
MAVSAQCHRVNVADGHMAAVRVKFARKPELNELREALAISFVAAGTWVTFRAGESDRCS